MSLFENPRSGRPDAGEPNEPLPVSIFSLEKRYDIYCFVTSEERLYEDVRIIGIRTFAHKKPDFGSPVFGGFIEIESSNGARMMIPSMRIHMVCEHGEQPVFKVLRARKPDGDE